MPALPEVFGSFMADPWGRWLVGLGFSLGVGHVVVGQFLKRLRHYMKLEAKPGQGPETQLVPLWLFGVGERFFFTLAVAFNISGTSVAMIAWLGLKLAANWNRPGREATQEELGPQESVLQVVRWSLSATIAGLLSMTFALLGGLICNSTIWPLD